MKHVLLLAVALVWLDGTSASAQELQKIGVVGSVQGNVTGKIDDKSAPQPLKVGDPIYLNQTIHADKNARAQLMFLDRSALTIISDADIKIDNFIYDPAAASGKMSMQSAKGAFRFVGGVLSKQDYVTFKTPVSTIGIRGGIVQVNVAEDGKANAIFFYGRDMMVKNDTGTQTVNDAGKGITVRDDKAAPEPMKQEEVNRQVHKFNNVAEFGREAGMKEPPPATDTTRATNTREGDKEANNKERKDGTAANAPANRNNKDGGPNPNGAPPRTDGTEGNSNGGNTSGTNTSSGAAPRTDGTATNTATNPMNTSGGPAAPNTTNFYNPMDTGGTNTSGTTPGTNFYNSPTDGTNTNTYTPPTTGTINTNVSPGATTGTNTNNPITTLDPNVPGSWGIWSQQIFFQGKNGTLADTPMIVPVVTGLPLLTGELSNLPTAFPNSGMISYTGFINGSTQLNSGGAPPTPQTGTFTANIDLSTRQLSNLSMFFGGFYLNNTSPTSSIRATGLQGTYTESGTTVSASGTANLGLYGPNAGIIAGQFSAGANTSIPGVTGTMNANGGMVGGKTGAQ